MACAPLFCRAAFAALTGIQKTRNSVIREREQTTTQRQVSHHSSLRPGGISPQDGIRYVVAQNQNKIRKYRDGLSRKLYARLDFARFWVGHPGKHETTYEPPATTAAKAPGYEKSTQSRRIILNCDIYINRSAVTGCRDFSRQRPRGVAPRDGPPKYQKINIL